MANNESISLVSGGQKVTKRNARGGLDKSSTTFVPFTPKSQATAITADSLKPVSPMKITPPRPSMEAIGLGGQITAQADQFDSYNANLAEQRKQAENAKTSSLADFTRLQAQQQGLESLTFNAENQQGLPDLDTELQDINNEIRQEERALELKLREFDKNTQGLFGGALEDYKYQAQKESLQKQADLSIIQMARQGKYNSAKAIADRQAKMQFERQNSILDAAQTTYLENKELFTTAEQRQFESLSADRARKLAKEEADFKTLQEQKLASLRMAQTNGAPMEVLRAIQTATTPEEVIAAGGQYGSVDLLDRKEKQLRIAKLSEELDDLRGLPTEIAEQVPTFDEWINIKEQEAQQTFTPEQRQSLKEEYGAEIDIVKRANALTQISPLAAEMLKNPKNFFSLTATEKGKVLKELANAGIDTGQIQNGKKAKLSATQADDIVQAQIARNGVLRLKELIDELQATGPVVGKARELNPYDPQVVAIMAEIKRIVPGLARGVFKEVGVLTDADVERYTSTLANPSATPEQIEQLHNDTMRKIDSSLETIFGTYDALGYDLGTFDVEEITGGSSEATQADIDYISGLNIE